MRRWRDRSIRLMRGEGRMKIGLRRMARCIGIITVAIVHVPPHGLLQTPIAIPRNPSLCRRRGNGDVDTLIPQLERNTATHQSARISAAGAQHL